MIGNAIEEVRFTKAEHASGIAGEFIHLGALQFQTPDQAIEFWDSIPVDGGQDPKVDDFNYMADMHTSAGLEDSKCVTAEFIEQTLKRPMREMLAEGKAYNDADEALNHRNAVAASQD